jgi:hypothetical protein
VVASNRPGRRAHAISAPQKTPAPDIIQKTQAPNAPDMLDAFLDGIRSLRRLPGAAL